MDLPAPYALFLGDVEPLSAKTATGIAHWRRDRCVAQVVLPGCSVDLKLPTLSPAAAAAAGARLLIVGVANFGGKLSPAWIVLCHALEREHIDGYEGYRIPAFEEAIATNEKAARLTNPRARVVGISVNSAKVPLNKAREYFATVEGALGLPCCDPVRTGVGAIADRLLALK